MTGRFVVLEGGDGSGKSTQLRGLVAWLREQGIEVVETFEPGATDAGAAIRELLLHRPDPIDPVAEALLMAADTREHVATVIRPALARGAWVVSDRFLPSSLVYQGVVRGLGVGAVAAINRLAVGEVAPDLVVLLDVSDVVAETRRASETDKLEAEGAAFHARGARCIPRPRVAEGLGHRRREPGARRRRRCTPGRSRPAPGRMRR